MLPGRALRAAARCAALGAAAYAAAPPTARLERAPAEAPAEAPSLREHGLLAGVGPGGAFYAPRLTDLRAAGALISKRGLLWAAAQADAAGRGQTAEGYIADVKRAAIDFVASNELVDRAAIVGALCSLVGSDKGTFSLLVGPKDVGKSLILRSLPATLDEDELGRKVVIVSARSTSTDLVQGIIDGVKEDESLRTAFIERLKELAPALSATMGSSFCTCK